MKKFSKKEKGTTVTATAAERAKDLEIDRLKMKLGSMQEQNDILKNRVKQCNSNLDTLIVQLKHKEKNIEDQKRQFENDISSLKKALEAEKIRAENAESRCSDLALMLEEQGTNSILNDSLNQTSESKQIEAEVKNLLNATSRGGYSSFGLVSSQDNIPIESDNRRITELENRNKELEDENKQLKEVALMIDNMINFAQNNDVLLKRKKDLQKKKNNLRVEIQKQMASLNELKNKVGPADDRDIFSASKGLSPNRERLNSGKITSKRVFEEHDN